MAGANFDAINGAGHGAHNTTGRGVLVSVNRLLATAAAGHEVKASVALDGRG